MHLGLLRLSGGYVSSSSPSSLIHRRTMMQHHASNLFMKEEEEEEENARATVATATTTTTPSLHPPWMFLLAKSNKSSSWRRSWQLTRDTHRELQNLLVLRFILLRCSMLLLPPQSIGTEPSDHVSTADTMQRGWLIPLVGLYFLVLLLDTGNQ